MTEDVTLHIESEPPGPDLEAQIEDVDEAVDDLQDTLEDVQETVNRLVSDAVTTDEVSTAVEAATAPLMEELGEIKGMLEVVATEAVTEPEPTMVEAPVEEIPAISLDEVTEIAPPEGELGDEGDEEHRDSWPRRIWNGGY